MYIKRTVLPSWINRIDKRFMPYDLTEYSNYIGMVRRIEILPPLGYNQNLSLVIFTVKKWKITAFDRVMNIAYIKLNNKLLKSTKTVFYNITPDLERLNKMFWEHIKKH